MFAFTAEVFILAENYFDENMVSRFTTLLSQIVEDLTKRAYYSDEVNTEYFNMLTDLF